MLGTLFDHVPAPPPPPRVRLRERRHACRSSYLRYPGKGTRIQVRWWLGGHGSVNCGLYDCERTAELVRRELVKETARHPATPLGLWEALRSVLARLGDRAGEMTPPLPMFVKRAKNGGYEASVKRGGKLVMCPGPYDTPEAAHLAIVAVLNPPVAAPTPSPPKVRLTLADYLSAAA